MDGLHELYAKIDRQGRRALADHQEDVDPYLTAATDDRWGLALILRLPAHVSRNITFVLQTLRAAEPDLYCYPAADMHITVMDIIGARPGLHLSSQQLARYRQAVAATVAGSSAIDWHLAGLVLSPGAVMVKGYYSTALQMLREKLRTNLAHRLDCRFMNATRPGPGTSRWPALLTRCTTRQPWLGWLTLTGR